MFNRILIANRGEIACRVIRTARRMGVETVAVYSDADAKARHVRLADHAIGIGPAAARESYLVGARILQAAKDSGAQAIHPGYGFLSENEDFARACADAGVVFIGPPASAIHAMGSKSAAKALMEKAGVPLTPGYHGDDQDPALLAREAERIGYPVLIKASAGGGGKGMRRVDRAADFEASLASCQREARNAFNDDHVLVEKYILKPRHIEIQVFGDAHGNCVHLFERDCSVQRRHQKVLEEAPAPGMTADRRAAMGKAAVDAARAVGYVGAGTVEFIANQDGSFYFMEMNTRLQVEHPVTEMITGLDLVEWQLRVASGEPLPLKQEQIRLDGHAIEARIYAEDPDRGFLPSTGRLIHLEPPPVSDAVRVDTGVEQGDEITPFYDPMIAKLIVHGEDRDAALARMRLALSQYRVVGVENNVQFLKRLISTKSFSGADLDTGLIEREQAVLFPDTKTGPQDEFWFLAALAEWRAQDSALRSTSRAAALRPSGSAVASGTAGAGVFHSPWSSNDAWRLNGTGRRIVTLVHGEETRELVATHERGRWQLQVNDPRMADRRQELELLGDDGRGRLSARIGGRRETATVVRQGDRRHVFTEDGHAVFEWIDPLQKAGAQAESQGGLRAPMPGKVIACMVKAGDAVRKGQALLVLEAMKMEHTISAPSDGIVEAVHCAAGDQVSDGFELITIGKARQAEAKGA